MKHLFIILLSFLAVACDKRMGFIAPQDDVTTTTDGTSGYWQLDSYYVGKKQVPISQAPGMLFLKTESDRVQADSIFKSFLYPKGASYWKFSFFNGARDKSSLLTAVYSDSDYRDKTKLDYQWYRITDTSGFLIILNLRDGPAKRMQLSNVIQSDNVLQARKYNVKLDSVRYIYRPAEKF